MKIRDRSKCATKAALDQAAHEGRILMMIVPTLVLFWVFAPKLETAYFPVVTEAELVAIEDAGDGWSRLEVRAEKLRECDWRAVEWHLGTRDGASVPVRAYFEDAPQMREIGALHWDGLMVRLTPEQVIRNSYGDVLHECWGGIGALSRSRYFTGDGK